MRMKWGRSLGWTLGLCSVSHSWPCRSYSWTARVTTAWVITIVIVIIVVIWYS